MASKRRVLDVDPRTGQMSDEAITCRSFGHTWVREVRGPRRSAAGEIKLVWACTTCGASRSKTLDTANWTVGGTRTRYPNGYRNPDPGTGRIAPVESMKAAFERRLL